MAKDKDLKETLDLEHPTEGYSFDELAKGIASGTLSRGQAIKLLGGAILGTLFASIAILRTAKAQECGGLNEHCCLNTTCIASGATCTSGICSCPSGTTQCGTGAGSSCCMDDTEVCSEGTCEPCGELGQPCCVGNTCNTGVCLNNTCTMPESPPPPPGVSPPPITTHKKHHKKKHKKHHH